MKSHMLVPVVIHLTVNLLVFIGIEHLEFIGNSGKAYICREVYFYLAFLSIFRSNYYNAVGCYRPINGCCRTIFQHFHRIYVLRID